MISNYNHYFLSCNHNNPASDKLHLNTFLSPFLSELQSLWKGVIMETSYGSQWIVRAALLSVSCDIPASRKVCGFTGHSAYHGCS